MTRDKINHTMKADRYRNGKTDTLDAYRAAQAAANQTQDGKAKQFHPAIEAIQVLMVARTQHKTARQRAWQRLLGVTVAAPQPLRESIDSLKPAQKLARIRAWRIDLTRLCDPIQAHKHALKDLATEIHGHDNKLAEYDRLLTQLLTPIAPNLLAEYQVGPLTAAQLLITAGHPGRIRNEAAFAKLTGIAPIPASSGKTSRVRLSRSGDRQANAAIHRVAVARATTDPKTKTYITKKLSEGHTRPEAIRALKRHLARSLYKALTTDLNNLDKT